MAGLLNAPKEEKQAKPSGKNPLLEKTATEIEAKVPQEYRKNYDAIVVSGMKIMFDKKTHEQMVQLLTQGPDISQAIAQGIPMLIALISQEAKGKIQREAAMLASVTLMTEALDYASRAMGVEITPDMLAQTTEMLKDEMFKMMNITPEMEQQAIQAGQQQQGGQARQVAAQPQPGAM